MKKELKEKCNWCGEEAILVDGYYCPKCMPCRKKQPKCLSWGKKLKRDKNMNLPQQTKEERDKKIVQCKIKETEQDQWVKDNGFTLQRDTCEKCLERRERDDRTYGGERMFCSQAHAYEINTIRKSLWVKDLRKEIFNTIYQWGRTGVVADENSSTIKKLLDDLENTYY